MSGDGIGMDDCLNLELQQLRDHGLLRRLRRIDQVDGVHIVVNGRELVSFGSNDYLGLAGHPDLTAAAQNALSWGAGATGSRLTSGNFALHEHLEESIARFKHTPAAIVFSSGYAANVGTIPALAGRGDLILSDSLNHASLIDGCRLSRAEVRVYNHADLDDLQQQLLDRDSFHRLLVVTDTVFSMDGDLAPLPDLVKICEEYDGWLMADDAHGTGVYGATGAGVVEHFGLLGRVQVQMGTLSKAVGCAGGFVAGSLPLIDILRNRARSFVYSTALPPADIAAASRSLSIIAEDHERRYRLMSNIDAMRSGLSRLGLAVCDGTSPIIPLIAGSAENAVQLSSALEEAGYWIPAIRPPTVPAETSRLRIAVTAAHTESQISGVLNAIERAALALPELRLVTNGSR